MKNSTIGLSCSAIALLCAISSSAHAVVPISVIASSSNGHVEQNTLDGNFETRWSAKGDDGREWLQYKFAGSPNVKAINISFFKGDERSTRFQIQSSTNGRNWNTELKAQSSSATAKMEKFVLKNVISASYIRIVGFGNSANAWNSINEVTFESGSPAAPAPTRSRVVASAPAAPVKMSATASSSNGSNSANKAVDGSMDTRWSTKGLGQWLRVDLGSEQTIDNVKIAFFQGDSRESIFSIEVSNNDRNWNLVQPKTSSNGKTSSLEAFSFNPVKARYIRYTGFGNSLNEWNSINEITVNGGSVKAAVVTPTRVQATRKVTPVAKPAPKPVPKPAPVVRAAPKPKPKPAPVIKAAPVPVVVPVVVTPRPKPKPKPVPVVVAPPVYPVTSDLSHSTGASCTLTVSSAAELKHHTGWGMPAGTTICLKDGIYKNVDLEFGGAGSERKPIVVTAITQGNVFFETKAKVRMEGSYVILKGIIFQNGYSISKDLIKTRGKGCKYCRMSEITIQNWDGAKNKKWFYSWNL